MNKICLFVEGNGETIFVEKVAKFLLEGRDATIVSFTLSGGKRYPRMELQREQTVLGSGADFYIQIVNSANEDRAISDARENAQRLADAEFERVLVLRDVAPSFGRGDVDRLRAGMALSLNGLPIPAFAFLQIMEFEAWLLCMSDHYTGIDGCLSTEAIVEEIGFLPECSNCEEIDRPSEVHAKILALAGILDVKSREAVTRVLDAFDLDVLVNDRAPQIDDLAQLVEQIDFNAA